MSQETKNAIIAILVVIVLLILSFFGGVMTERYVFSDNRSDTTVVYVQGTEIHDSITIEKPVYKYFPLEVDSIGIAKYLYDEGKLNYLIDSSLFVVDTAAIIAEFVTVNKYHIDVFDEDTLGKLNVDMDVQFNELKDFRYSFTPNNKVITVTQYKVRKFEPYVGLGCGFVKGTETNNMAINVQAGFYMKEHYGVGAQYWYETDGSHTVSLNLLYKL